MKSVIIARALALLWAGFWIFFFVVESWAWKTPARVAVFWAALGVLFLIVALLPWAWERGGGVLLAILGLSVGAVYPFWAPSRLTFASRATTTLMLCGPPIAAGIIFLKHRRTLAPRP
ncbi:MAG: hypothetical protein WAO35_11885 [Terriglobia bacterium]